MEHRITKKYSYFIAIALISVLGSCYYDNESELYPTNDYPTVNVSYATNVNPIIVSSCNSCHSTSAKFGNIITDTYLDLKKIVDNGKFIGSIKHNSGFIAMPQSSAKLNTAQIAMIEAWITEGAKNN